MHEAHSLSAAAISQKHLCIRCISGVGLGARPDEAIDVPEYGQDLADKHARDCLSVFNISTICTSRMRY